MNIVNVLAEYDITKWPAVQDREAYEAFVQLIYMEDKAEADRQRAHKARLQK